MIDSHPAPRPKDVRRSVRRRRCSRARWPRFSQLAFGPHPSRHSSETASPHPAACQKDVRRGVRRRHCSRVRWPRFPHLAFGPHPSRHGSETAFSHPVTCQKDVRRGVRRRDRGQRPTATKDPNTKRLRRSVHFSTRAWHFLAKHSQGDALSFRMAPRWRLGCGHVSAIGGLVFF